MTGQELMLWRRERKLTQAKLAQLLEVTTKTVNRWEMARHRLPMDIPARLEKLAYTLAPKPQPVQPKWVTPMTAPHLYYKVTSPVSGAGWAWKPEHPIMLLGEACKVTDPVSGNLKTPWEVLASDAYQAALARYRSSQRASTDALTDEEWQKKLGGI